MKKLYEHEIERNNISPKQFFTYCKNQLSKKGIDLGIWLDSYKDWTEPIAHCNDAYNHEDWEEPQKEVCKTQPYNWQLFLQNTYNFIMEFDFCDDNRGFGYLYVCEFER